MKNKRLKELADQCTEYVDDGGYGYEEFDKEKFAELIVRECSQLAHNAHPDELPFVGGKILEHFGVEE